jgi:DNA (cytosine-5)-methyltransferase 1
VPQAVAFDCKASGRNGFGIGDTSPTLRSMGHADGHQSAGGHVAVMTLAIRGRGDGHDLETRDDGIANAILTPNGGRAGIGVGAIAAFTCSEQSNSFAWERDVAPTVDAQIPNDTSNIQKGVRIGSAVRRLTVEECEALQGFPRGYTLVTHRNKLAADGPRYKALGNSMAVPCMRWIGERIHSVELLTSLREAA